MQFVVFKQKVKAAASLLGIVALALALGIGATSAILHPGWLNELQPSVGTLVFAEQSEVDISLPAATLTVSTSKRVRLWDIVD